MTARLIVMIIGMFALGALLMITFDSFVMAMFLCFALSPFVALLVIGPPSGGSSDG